MSQLKLLTCNLHGLEEPNPSAALRTLAAHIVAQHYDVVFLQEIVALLQPKSEDPIDHSGEFLLACLRELGCHDYHLTIAYCHEAWGTCDEYVGILTRWPLLEQTALLLSESDDPKDFNRRVAMRAVIDVNGTPLQFMSCHFSWADSVDPFSGQFNTLDTFIQASGFPTIIAGDFNIPSFSPDYMNVINAGYRDLYLVTSPDADWTIQAEIDGWEGRGQAGRRIDFMFANTPFIIESSQRRFYGDDHPMLSDHAFVEVIISLSHA